MKDITIGVIYGGKSTEHEVSVHSAGYVCELLEKKYKLVKIYISREGKWYAQEKCGYLQGGDKPVSPVVNEDYNLYGADGKTYKIDVFFPVLHGAMGEDGTIQGLFEILGAPYVGCGVLTGALGMDKELCKLLASFYGIKIAPYIKLEKTGKYDMAHLEAAVKALGYPVFVKPMSLGSSVGVTRVDDGKALPSAIDKAFKYEGNILVEKGIDKAREVFCSVIGDGKEIHTSLCGELKTVSSAFFDYKAKYEDPHGCDMNVPADIPEAMQDEMRKASATIFKVLRGKGFARIDFLLGLDGQFYFSEINTLPGMSATSLFPQLWEASGKKYDDVLDILIKTAFDRKNENDAYSIER